MINVFIFFLNAFQSNMLEKYEKDLDELCLKMEFEDKWFDTLK